MVETKATLFVKYKNWRFIVALWFWKTAISAANVAKAILPSQTRITRFDALPFDRSTVYYFNSIFNSYGSREHFTWGAREFRRSKLEIKHWLKNVQVEITLNSQLRVHVFVASAIFCEQRNPSIIDFFAAIQKNYCNCWLMRICAPAIIQIVCHLK